MLSSEKDIPNGSSSAGHTASSAAESDGPLSSAERRELERLRIRFAQGTELTRPIFWEYDIAADRMTAGDDEATRDACARLGLPAVLENASANAFDLIAEEDRDVYRAMMREVQAGHDATFEVWCKPIPGSEPHCLRESYKVVCDVDGNPVMAYGMGVDVTVEKDAEKHYEQERDRLTQVGLRSIASFHLNLTKDWVGDGRSDLESVLKQQEKGTVDAYRAEFSKLIADDKVKE